MFETMKPGLLALVPALLVGCARDYSPNTYSGAAVQQANKVAQGVVAGYREVEITPDGTVGTVTGGAAGGIFGAQAPGGGVTTALSTLGGTVLGGLVGSAVEHASANTTAFEYIVRKNDGDLLSVTQKDQAPLAIGLKVLVIYGNQARIVPDYSVPPPEPAPPPAAKEEKPAEGAAAATPRSPSPAEPTPTEPTRAAEAPPAAISAPTLLSPLAAPAHQATPPAPEAPSDAAPAPAPPSAAPSDAAPPASSEAPATD